MSPNVDNVVLDLSSDACILANYAVSGLKRPKELEDMSQDTLSDYWSNVSWHVFSNPNGGTQVYMIGCAMLFICIYLLMYFIMIFVISGQRSKYFTKEFMQQFFSEFSHELSPGGSPDLGCGYFSAKLPYADWVRFNRAQRIHQNFFETCVVVLVMMAIGMVNFPLVSSIAMIVYIVGRSFYACMGSKHCRGCELLFFIFLILLPFYTLFGNGVGQILQQVRMKSAPTEKDMPTMMFVPYQRPNDCVLISMWARVIAQRMMDD